MDCHLFMRLIVKEFNLTIPQRSQSFFSRMVFDFFPIIHKEMRHNLKCSKKWQFRAQSGIERETSSA